MSDDRGARSSQASTRAQLLNSARELVLERFRNGVAPHHALAYLTPAAVAQHAGLSRGTIYHYWGGHESTSDDRPFERFLAEVAEMLWEESVDIEDLDLLSSLLPDNMSDLILELTAFEIARLSAGDGAVMFRASATMALHGVDLSRHFAVSIDQLAVLYQVGLARLGRKVRAPLETRDVAQTVASLTAGTLLNDLFDPGSAARSINWTPSVPQTSSDKVWTLFAIAVEAVLLNMSEPI
ncbi:hypothetical protein BH10ACT3_BH10ACT3_09310 [soil metagenome]